MPTISSSTGRSKPTPEQILRSHRCDCQPLYDLAEWLVALDEPGSQERRTVTMAQIINRARAALGETEE